MLAVLATRAFSGQYLQSIKRKALVVIGLCSVWGR